MSIIEKLKPSPKGPAVPPMVQEKVNRATEAMDRDRSKRRLAHKFWTGDQYWYLNNEGQLRWLSTATGVGSGSRPPHRIRNNYNFIRMIVEGKVSAATQRVPGYEVTPSTNDPEDIAAARISQQVTYYGYDQWRLRRVKAKACTLAFVQREAFALPYFDPNCGPFYPIAGGTPDKPSLEFVGQGEVKVRLLSRSQVGWEPGCDFDDSPFYLIKEARPISEVERYPGFLGGRLAPDAQTADTPVDPDAKNHVVVTEYLERPCPDYPVGRRLIMANGHIICPEEPYPLEAPDGSVLDEPVLHRLSYTVNPEGDDLGLVELLIDLQRTINDCWNKLLEWKNRCLNPQMIAPVGSLRQRPDDVPGSVKYYNPVGGMKPEWERPPAVPSELFGMLDQAVSHMRAIASDVDAQAEPDVAAKTIQQAVEQARLRWQSFLGDLAEWDSRVMRHCLMLVGRHYQEERLIQIRGLEGWEPLAAFTGQNLRGQVNVRVNPGSLEVKSRQAVLAEVQWITQMFPGSITPQEAMAAVRNGTTDNLLKSYMLDVARANDLVQRIRNNHESLLAAPLRPDGNPDWMPRKQDDIGVWKKVFGDYMKTPAFSDLPPEVQEMFNLVWDGLEMLEAQRAMQQAMFQQQMAEGLGMANAAAPQNPAPLPDQKKLTA